MGSDRVVITVTMATMMADAGEDIVIELSDSPIYLAGAAQFFTSAYWQ